MDTVYSVDLRHSNGNMHVGVTGEFNEKTADAILNLLKKAYNGTGRIFIDTAKIQYIAESAAEYFKNAFAETEVPSACLFFKGEKGKSLGPNGSKLIILKEREKKHQCCGNCKNCTCKNHHSYN